MGRKTINKRLYDRVVAKAYGLVKSKVSALILVQVRGRQGPVQMPVWNQVCGQTIKQMSETNHG